MALSMNDPLDGATSAVSDIWFLLGSIRHYFPSRGRQTEPRLAPRSGNLTPPRISPSCPHCLILKKSGLWLGRGTIVGRRGHCETACQSCFWMDGNRWAPYLAVVFDAGNLHRWSWRIFRIAFPFLKARPPMLFSHRICTFQGPSKRTAHILLSLFIGNFFGF